MTEGMSLAFNIVINLITVSLPVLIFVIRLYREIGEIKTEVKNIKERIKENVKAN